MTSFVLLKVGKGTDMTKPFGVTSKDTKMRFDQRPKGAYRTLNKYVHMQNMKENGLESKREEK